MNQSLSLAEAEYLMQCRGWVVFPAVLQESFLNRLREDLMLMYEKRREAQIKSGIGAVMDGTCHFILGDGNSMDELLALLPLHEYMTQFFSGKYILNSFGAFINKPHDTAYVSNIHRDVRTFSGSFRLLMNMLIMLDDFTLENGATYVLSGSHHLAEKPASELFYHFANRVTGKAGDIVAFDSNLWHAAGENHTDKIRRGLTLTYSRPFFKQQIDFPRFVGEAYCVNASADVQQILGYNARVPASIDEFYQPPEKRFYKPGQG